MAFQDNADVNGDIWYDMELLMNDVSPVGVNDDDLQELAIFDNDFNDDYDEFLPAATNIINEDDLASRNKISHRDLQTSSVRRTSMASYMNATLEHSDSLRRLPSSSTAPHNRRVSQSTVASTVSSAPTHNNYNPIRIGQTDSDCNSSFESQFQRSLSNLTFSMQRSELSRKYISQDLRSLHSIYSNTSFLNRMSNM